MNTFTQIHNWRRFPCAFAKRVRVKKKIHVHVSLLTGGYYTVNTTHGLRIIALNTNLYYTSNKATKDSPDPGQQLAWLNATLDTATADGEKVYCSVLCVIYKCGSLSYDIMDGSCYDIVARSIFFKKIGTLYRIGFELVSIMSMAENIPRDYALS